MTWRSRGAKRAFPPRGRDAWQTIADRHGRSLAYDPKRKVIRIRYWVEMPEGYRRVSDPARHQPQGDRRAPRRPQLGVLWRDIALGQWWEAAFLLTAFGGCRVGESLGIRSEDASLVDVSGRVSNRLMGHFWDSKSSCTQFYLLFYEIRYMFALKRLFS